MRRRVRPVARVKRDPEAFLARLRHLDETLAARGFPRISPWWWETLERFYRSGRRRLVVRKGRRVGASTIVAPRLAVAEALWGEHAHAPGTPPLVFAFVSVRRGEAANRLRGIRAILDVLGEPYAPGVESIELKGRPVLFSVVTASFRTAVGDTVAFAWCDEVARWRDEETGANPASEVVSAITPALATLPEARMFLVSSPLTDEDFHAAQFRRGDDELQVVAQCSAWEGNPTLSREDCEKLEPDPRTFAREFEGVPTAAVSAAFESVDEIIAWGVKSRPFQHGTRYGVTFDAGENRSHTVALAFHFENRQVGAEMQRVLVVDRIDVLKPSLFKLRRVGFDDVVTLVADLCRAYRVQEPRGDRHVHSPLGAALRQRGIQLPRDPMGVSLGEQARRSRSLIDRVRAGTIDLIEHDDAVKQLRGAVVRERGGQFIVTTANKRAVPDDVLDAILLACDEEEFKQLPASGGSGVRSRLRVSNAGHVPRAWTEWFRVIRTADGREIEVPASPPVGSIDHQVAIWERWRRGAFTPDEMNAGRSLEEMLDEASRGLADHA